VAEQTSLLVKALVSLAHKMDVNTAQLEWLILEKQLSHNLKFMYWLVMNGCECQSMIYAMAEFLNLCQEGTFASISQGLFLKIMVLHWNE
jgi:hypothetical protein